MGMGYYDRQGKPLADTLEWGRLHSDDAYKRVASTQIGPLWVSTVWLGMDHSFGENDAPLIFETMVFRMEDGASSDDLDCRRYSTEAEALAGHEEVLAEIRERRFVGYGYEEVDYTFEITEEPTLT